LRGEGGKVGDEELSWVFWRAANWQVVLVGGGRGAETKIQMFSRWGGLNTRSGK